RLMRGLPRSSGNTDHGHLHGYGWMIPSLRPNEHRHLGRRSVPFVRRANCRKYCGIAEAFNDLCRPRPKLIPRPLEPMVGMAVPPIEVWKQDIVLGIGRGDNYGFWPRRTEHDLGHGRQPIGIEMLDHFDQHGGVRLLPALVAIGQRAMEQGDALLIRPARKVELEPIRGALQGTSGGIETDEAREPSVTDK